MPSQRATNHKNAMKKLREHQKNRVIDRTELVEDKIDLLKSRIKNCEWDLETFPDNPIIKAKIKNMEDELNKLEDEN